MFSHSFFALKESFLGSHYRLFFFSLVDVFLGYLKFHLQHTKVLLFAILLRISQKSYF